jgi:GH24 family phage-related lysozyme (muramidase)
MPANNATPPRGKAQRAGIAASVAIAVGVCAPLTMRSEGVRTVPYLDPAHIRTVCYGETQHIEDRVYSRGECGDMLRSRLASAYAPELVECMPGLVEEPYPATVFAGLLDASYNAGPQAVCRKFAPLFNARWIAATCAALPGWYVTARDRRSGAVRQLRGLEDRRLREQRLCLGQMA